VVVGSRLPEGTRAASLTGEQKTEAQDRENKNGHEDSPESNFRRAQCYAQMQSRRGWTSTEISIQRLPFRPAFPFVGGADSVPS